MCKMPMYKILLSTGNQDDSLVGLRTTGSGTGETRSLLVSKPGSSIRADQENTNTPLITAVTKSIYLLAPRMGERIGRSRSQVACALLRMQRLPEFPLGRVARQWKTSEVASTLRI